MPSLYDRGGFLLNKKLRVISYSIKNRSVMDAHSRGADSLFFSVNSTDSIYLFKRKEVDYVSIYSIYQK